jgi:DNA-binding phage protein
VTGVGVTGGTEAERNSARALVALLVPLVEYLESVAQAARDAQVVAEALRRALADERVQAALALRALEK